MEEKPREEKLQTEVGASPEEARDQGVKKKRSASDVGIFVFLGVMASLMIGAIVFVVYICSGSATGCNCAQCTGKVGMVLRELTQAILR